MTSRGSRWLLSLCISAHAAGCRPDLDDRESLITAPRVLAIRGEPAEAKPGQTVRYALLLATPEGPVATPNAHWAFCMTPKALTENGAVSAACLGDGVRPLAASAPEIEAALPSEGCNLFGPEVTSADLRPRDPDVTGGYYQPLRVQVFGHGAPEDAPLVAFGLHRITCNLANAAAEVARDFGLRYAANRNPEIASLTASLDGRPVTLDAVARGARLTWRVSWSAESAEPYVVYDLAQRGLVTRREALRVSWFATSGVFAHDRTGRDEAELDAFSENEWTAPQVGSHVHVFVVVRDARGGVAYATQPLQVR